MGDGAGVGMHFHIWNGNILLSFFLSASIFNLAQVYHLMQLFIMYSTILQFKLMKQIRLMCIGMSLVTNAVLSAIPHKYP